MTIKAKKLFFNTLDIIHDANVLELMTSSNFHKITIYSYDTLNLPATFVLARTKTTTLIRLDGKTKDDVFNSFNDTVRNEINKTLKDGDFHFVQNESDKRNAYKMYCQFELTQNRAPVSFDFFSKLLIFEAYYRGELLSSIASFDCGKVLKIFAISSKRLDYKNDPIYKVIGQAGKRLMFEVCKYGIDNAISAVDLAYVNFNDPEKAGITSYKMKFGGDVVEEYRYEYKSKLFKLFEKFINIKLWFLKKYSLVKLNK